METDIIKVGAHIIVKTGLADSLLTQNNALQFLNPFTQTFLKVELQTKRFIKGIKKLHFSLVCLEVETSVVLVGTTIDVLDLVVEDSL